MARRAAALRRRLEALFGIDVRSLAALRIGLGLVIGVDLLGRACAIAACYSDRGVLPRTLWTATVKPSDLRFPSVHLLSGSAAFEAALLAAGLLFAGMLLVGWRTRLATLASWYLLLSLQVRNPFLLDAGDRILGLLLFWSIFLPLGAAASIDARRAPRSAPRRVFSPASAALLIQFACVYLFAGLSKSGPEWRSQGTAIFYVMSLSYWVKPLGEWLLGLPGLLRLLSFGTVAFELLGPLLLFSPVATARVRCVMIPAFWVFQHSLRLTIELGVFPWICSVAILPFVPALVWDRAGALARRLPGVGSRLRRVADAGGTAPSATPRRPGLPRQVAEAAFVLLVLIVLGSNLGVLDRRLALPASVRGLVAVPRLTQGWGMYGPGPSEFDYGFLWDGVRRDGREVELFEEGAGPHWERAARLHRSYRFKMYVEALARKGETFQSGYLRWLCRAWNADAAPGKEIESVRLRMWWSTIVPGGDPEPRQERVVFDLGCDARDSGSRAAPP